MQGQRRNIYAEYGMKHVQIPKVFFTNEKYMNMKNDTKIAWSILSDRSNLSLKNNWIDEKGDIYFIFSNKELMKILNCSEPKVISIKNELLEHGLLDQERIGMNKPNKLYIKDPSVTGDDIYKIQEQEEGLDIYPDQKENNEPSNSSETRNLKNLSTGTKKTLVPELKKFKPSNTDLNNTDLSNTKLKDQSIDKRIALLDLPGNIKTTLNKYQKRLIDDNISLIDIESNYKAHRELLTVGEYQSALNFVLAKFERPIASIEAAMKTAITKKLELREKAHQSNKPKEDTMPKWYKEEQENTNEKIPSENFIDEKQKFEEMLKKRQENKSKLG